MTNNIKFNPLAYLFIITVLLIPKITFAGENALPTGVSIYQLDNGIQVLLIEKKTLPMVGINTVVKVGSAYESFATSGMSHMLEHLLFNGTKEMTQKELYDAVDKIGGYNNANTSEYYTNFMMVTPAENIEQGMKIQAAMLFESTLPEKKFEKEKGIVLEEIAKSLGNSNEQAERNIISVIYKGHALSLPTLGTYETIKHMNRDEVYSFYKNYYVPNNMIISVIGNFNTTDMLAKLKEIYGKYSPGNVEYPSNMELKTGFNLVPELQTDGDIIHRFYGGKNYQLQLFYSLPNKTEREFYDLIDLYLKNKLSELKRKLTDKFGKSITGVSFSTRSYPVKNYLETTVLLKDDSHISLIKDFVKSELLKYNFQLSNDVVEGRAISAKTSFLKNVEKPHMFGIYNANIFAEYGIEAILRKYSGEGFKTAATAIGKLKLQGNSIVILQHPPEKSAAKPSSQNIVPVLFENGAGRPVVIAKQATGSSLLAIHYLFKHKSFYESEFGKNAAQIWHDAFGERMKSPEVQKISKKFGFSFTVNDNPFIPMDNIYLDPSFGYIRVEGLADNVKEAVEFLNKQMLNFTPTQIEYEKAVGVSKRAMMMGHTNPAKLKYTAIRDSLLYVPNDLSVPPKLTYESLLRFGEKYFAPGNIIVSVVSPESPDNINLYFQEFYKPENDQVITGSPLMKTFNEITETKIIDRKGGGAQSYLYFGFQKSVSPDEYPALKVLSLLLRNKIIFDIREKQGMAYRMSAGIERHGEKAMFYIDMATRPENTDKLIPQFPEFFTTDFADEITEDDLIKSVNMYLGRMMFRRLSSINQAYYLAHSYYFDNDIFYDGKFLESLKKVTIDEVKDVAEKYLGIENYVEVIVR